MSTSHLSSVLFTLTLIPFGVAVGTLSERIASKKVPFIPNRIWNTVIKVAAATILWVQFIARQQDVCLSLYLLNFNKSDSQDAHAICSSVDQMALGLITLIIKILFLYVSTKLGTSLQPVGLTGGIACGKSTVSKLLRGTSQSNRKDAFAVVDVDEIAHDILVPGKMKKEDCAYYAVVSAFKNDDILEEAKDRNEKLDHPPIDRRKLGDIIFPDPKKRRKLNSITHPLISKVMMKQIIGQNFFPSSNDTSSVAVDIPLLFEVGAKMKALFSIKVVVACSSELQFERLRSRNPDLTKEQCQKRIESQIPVYKKVEMADVVIWNNGSIDDLIMEVETAREEILSRKHGLLGISLPMLIVTPGIVLGLDYIYNLLSLNDMV